MDETMDTVAAAAPASKRTPVDQEVECPLRDVQLTGLTAASQDFTLIRAN
jgi:hypothetical protein